MESRFWEILAKKLCHQATDSELSELDDLLAKNQHLNEYITDAELHAKAFDLSDEIDFSLDWEKAWTRIQTHPKHETPLTINWKWVGGIAAILALGLLATHFFFRNEVNKTSYFADGSTEHFVLEDGSTIWLRANSRLTLDQAFNSDAREVFLEGEAFFQVSEDTTKPFIVNANDSKTTVLGTEFNVRAFKDDSLVKVSLYSGKVSFNTASHKTILTPHNYAVYDLRDGSILQDTLYNHNDKAWKNGELEFDNIDFEEVITAMEDYFGVTAEVNNPTILNCKITAFFEDPELQEFLDVVSLLLDITYEIKEDHIVFDGEGCILNTDQ